jgi:hypothetical protein
LLDELVREEGWRQLRSSHGTEYADFAQMATDERPCGLGVRDRKDASSLKQALLMHDHVPAWAEVVDRIATGRGRPRKNLAAGESFRRFYRLHRSKTALDRIVLRLYQAGRTDLLADIGSRRITAKAAAEAALQAESQQEPVAAGREIAAGPRGRGAKDLRRRFRTAGVEAQCALIACELQPHLGMDLAERWRALKGNRAPNAAAQSAVEGPSQSATA